MYTIDAKNDPKYFLVINEDGNAIKIAKSCNDLEAVKKLVGLINIKEIILDEKEQ